MKSILATFLFLCTSLSYAQTFNQEIQLENGKKFLLGKINLEGLESEPYKTWFQPNFESYAVDKTMVSLFEQSLKGHYIKLFLGTWCGDSKREVPRFLKILKAANFPMDHIEIVALDRRKGKVKTSPTFEEKGLNIIRVPSMLFYKNGKEVNRIVESPIESLEEDILQIVNNKAYTANYMQ
ncbi:MULTISPECIES: TlpA family protein disulfide reductase [Flavobacteriaceae]|uniref:TlpA family protein disulfide reductase n=1 Tax=Flavobacteriaceae TaxID=49546 RepID=UPI001491D9D5|nr:MULTISPECIES: thioredoxin family protein [Allomuricauda]MDC6365715.1 thioredoxin family protein [Muricauda sp. AC10]